MQGNREINHFFSSLFTTRWGIASLGYIVVIYLTLPIMRQLSNWFIAALGDQHFQMAINITMAGTGALLLTIGLKRRALRSVSVIIPLGVATIMTVSLEMPIERIHFIEYGTLSIMILAAVQQRTHWQLLLAFIFVCIVGMGDELIQWWLPNRVGDVRDIVLNAIGGGLGIWFGKLLVWD